MGQRRRREKVCFAMDKVHAVCDIGWRGGFDTVKNVVVRLLILKV